MKSQEQRIKDATVVAEQLLADVRPPRVKASYLAERILEAADREPPKWPTDDSCGAFRLTILELGWGCPPDCDLTKGLRAAMLADPIIKAAVALRDAYRLPECLDPQVSDLVDAVNEAGL